jgi:regulator of protease activity HflC (stomatin/prohibitin superfamily)
MCAAGFRGNERAASTVQTIVGLILLLLIVGIALGSIPFSPLLVLGVLLLIAAIAVVSTAVEIVDPYEKRVLTVLGDFREVLEPGIHLVPPLVSATTTYDMRTHTVDVPKQEAITRDNSPVVANAVLYIRVMDAKKAFLEVEDYLRATSNLAQTTLRAVLGDMELDDTLSKREKINEKIREELSEPTDQWGIRVESVEVKEITPSQDVLSSMEQQTAAERRRRAMILEAQGERRSAIERAEGDKRSDIITAQGEKQAQILEAQGDAISTVLRSKSADAMGEQAVIDRSLETLQTIGEGPSETYVLPQEFSSVVGKFGKQFVDDAVPDEESLKGTDFDAEDREILGLDDIDEILGEIEDVDTMGDVAADAHGDEIAGGQTSDVGGETDEIAGGQTSDVGGETDEIAGGQSRDVSGRDDDFAGGEESESGRTTGQSGEPADGSPTEADDETAPTGMPDDGDDTTLDEMWSDDDGSETDRETETEEDR